MPHGYPAHAPGAGAWRADEIDTLRDLAALGWRAGDIASVLCRTEASVRGKASGTGIHLVSDRKPKPVTLRRLMLAGD